MINHIHLENFKSIRTLDLALEQITIIIGANGAGKSNFISFFKLADRLFRRSFQDYVAEQAGADNLLYFGLKNSNSLSFSIEFDSKNRYYCHLKPNTEGGLYIETEGTQFHHGFPGWDDVELGKSQNESQLINQQYGRYAYVKEYLNSFKVYHFHDTSSRAGIKQKRNLDDNESLRGDAANLAAFLYYLQEKHHNQFLKIERVVRSVAPFFDKFLLKPDRTREDLIRLEWKEKGSDMYLNATHLSDGTLRFMALATLLMQPQPPKTIVIDEPELGLHPFAIAKLAGLIRQASEQSQIVVSTQSVSLVDGFQPENVVTVDRFGGQSVFKRLHSDALAGWMQEYSLGELWNKNVIGAKP